jgi:hypothetical protein
MNVHWSCLEAANPEFQGGSIKQRANIEHWLFDHLENTESFAGGI